VPDTDGREQRRTIARDVLVTDVHDEAEVRRGMKIRTLISNQLYFGLEPLAFRRGAGRALQRVSKLPPEQVRVNAQTLGRDFRLDSAGAHALVDALVAKGLLQADPTRAGEYRLTDRFAEFALARVVPPLPRMRAKELLDQACKLATKINAEWGHNPLMIEMIAVSGSYMSRHSRISELTLWPVLKRRPEVSAWRLGHSITKADAAMEITSALRGLSSFVVVRTVSEKNRNTIERPFAVPFRHQYAEHATPPSAKFWSWGSSLRRQLIGR
jgi:hypothetical protein